MQAGGVLLALLILGFDFLWFALALIGVADVFIKKQATYTLTWWSVVFPTVTVTTAILQLANAMDSPAFRGIYCALTMFIAIAYNLNLGFTIRGIINGTVIFGKTQAEIEDGIMKKAQDEPEKKQRGVV